MHNTLEIEIFQMVYRLFVVAANPGSSSTNLTSTTTTTSQSSTVRMAQSSLASTSRCLKEALRHKIYVDFCFIDISESNHFQ